MTLVLVNPHAQGGRVRRLLPALREAVEAQMPFARLLAPDGLDDALHILQRETPGARVVLVGGDGSFNRWLPALLTQQLTVGLLPLGCGNDLARALLLNRRDWRQALSDALHGQPAPMDTGLAVWTDLHGDVHRTPFASSLTCGFDSAVALRAQQGPRWLPILFTSVLNTPTFGSGLPAVPQARIDDGQLDWLRAGPFGRWATLAMLPQLALGTHLRHPMVGAGHFRQLQLRCETGVPLAADGEWLGQARQVQVSVHAASLQVIRPPA